VARVAGYLTRYERRRVSPSTDYMGISRAVVRDFQDQTELTVTLLVEGDLRGLTALGQGRVVLHDGSCDADRLGGLERERDEWRRKCEAATRELEATRAKLPNATGRTAARVNAPWVPQVGEFVRVPSGLVGAVLGVGGGTVPVVTVRFFQDDGGGAFDVAVAIADLEPAAAYESPRARAKVNGTSVRAAKKKPEPPADPRFSALDLDVPEED
jgi:hypothetical protein